LNKIKGLETECDFVSYLPDSYPAQVKIMDLTLLYDLIKGCFSMILCQLRQGWEIGLCLGKPAVDVGKAAGTGELD
jgi:hypothetical protein